MLANTIVNSVNPARFLRTAYLFPGMLNHSIYGITFAYYPYLPDVNSFFDFDKAS